MQQKSCFFLQDSKNQDAALFCLRVHCSLGAHVAGAVGHAIYGNMGYFLSYYKQHL